MLRCAPAELFVPLSIDLLVIRGPANENSISVTNQRTASAFFARLAQEHDLRILTGTYPVWVEEADLQELIREACVRACFRGGERKHAVATPAKGFVKSNFRRRLSFS